MSWPNHQFFRNFAWKSILRNPGRSFFIIFTVSLAVTLSLWIMVFFEGLNTQMERAVVDTNTGFFQLLDPAYAKKTDPTESWKLSEALLKDLTSYPVTAFSPELLFDGYVLAPEGSAAVTVIGVEPQFHQKVVAIKDHIESGEYLSRNDGDQVFVGSEMARFFKYKVGDTFVLNYQDHLGELRSEILVIKGIYRFNSNSFQKKNIYISQKTWQRLFMNKEESGTFFNRIVLMTKNLKSHPELEVTFLKSGLILKTWKQINPEISVVIDFQRGMMNFFFLIIGVTITMTILTPVRMMWQERLKELKMLNVIGVTKKVFWKIAVQEIILMVGLCGALSLILTGVVISINSYTGIDFGLIEEGDVVERAGIIVPKVVFPILTWEHLLLTGVFVIFVLAMSYAWSIHKVLKEVEAER